MATIGWIALAAAGLALLVWLELQVIHALSRGTWVIVNAWYGREEFRVRARTSREAVQIATALNGRAVPIYAEPLSTWRRRRRREQRALRAANAREAVRR